MIAPRRLAVNFEPNSFCSEKQVRVKWVCLMIKLNVWNSSNVSHILPQGSPPVAWRMVEQQCQREQQTSIWNSHRFLIVHCTFSLQCCVWQFHWNQMIVCLEELTFIDHIQNQVRIHCSWMRNLAVFWFEKHGSSKFLTTRRVRNWTWHGHGWKHWLTWGRFQFSNDAQEWGGWQMFIRWNGWSKVWKAKRGKQNARTKIKKLSWQKTSRMKHEVRLSFQWT